MGLEYKELTTTKYTVWEDNIGALTLAHLELLRVTPRSKYSAVKYHWFHKKFIPRLIEIQKVATNVQLADIFTKSLWKDKFVEM